MGFWRDAVALARNLGFGPVELRRVHRLVVENRNLLWEKWYERFQILIPENAYETYTSLKIHWRWTSQTAAQSSFP